MYSLSKVCTELIEFRISTYAERFATHAISECISYFQTNPLPESKIQVIIIPQSFPTAEFCYPI